MDDVRELLSWQNEEMLFLTEPEYDAALIGCVEICGHTVALYDSKKVIEILMEQGLTEEEAMEHYDYNIRGSYVGENTPGFAYLLEDI